MNAHARPVRIQPRPCTVADCLPDFSREGAWHVCPWVSCRKHLALSVDTRGRLRINRALLTDDHDLVADGSRPCCQVEAVFRLGASTLEAVGHTLSVSRERVRQIEEDALETLQARARFLREYHTPVSVEQIQADRVKALELLALLDAAPPPYDPRTHWRDLPRGHRLRRIRQRLGWTAAALARDVGASRSLISNAESGNRVVSRASICRFLDRLGAPHDALERGRPPSVRLGTLAATPPRAANSGASSSLRLDYLIGASIRSHNQPFALRAERVRRLFELDARDMAARLGASECRYRRLERGDLRPTSSERVRLFRLNEDLLEEAAA